MYKPMENMELFWESVGHVTGHARSSFLIKLEQIFLRKTLSGNYNINFLTYCYLKKASRTLSVSEASSEPYQNAPS